MEKKHKLHSFTLHPIDKFFKYQYFLYFNSDLYDVYILDVEHMDVSLWSSGLYIQFLLQCMWMCMWIMATVGNTSAFKTLLYGTWAVLGWRYSWVKVGSIMQSTIARQSFKVYNLLQKKLWCPKSPFLIYISIFNVLQQVTAILRWIHPQSTSIHHFIYSFVYTGVIGVCGWPSHRKSFLSPAQTFTWCLTYVSSREKDALQSRASLSESHVFDSDD